MNNVFIYSWIMIFSVFISSISQIILKKSALKSYKNVMNEYLNPYVIGAYIIFFISTFITIYALKYVPLSMGPILESTGYVFIVILSRLFLKEAISKKKIMGMGIILIGIIVFSFEI